MAPSPAVARLSPKIGVRCGSKVPPSGLGLGLGSDSGEKAEGTNPNVKNASSGFQEGGAVTGLVGETPFSTEGTFAAMGSCATPGETPSAQTTAVADTSEHAFVRGGDDGKPLTLDDDLLDPSEGESRSAERVGNPNGRTASAPSPITVAADGNLPLGNGGQAPPVPADTNEYGLPITQAPPTAEVSMDRVRKAALAAVSRSAAEDARVVAGVGEAVDPKMSTATRRPSSVAFAVNGRSLPCSPRTPSSSDSSPPRGSPRLLDPGKTAWAPEVGSDTSSLGTTGNVNVGDAGEPLGSVSVTPRHPRAEVLLPKAKAKSSGMTEKDSDNSSFSTDDGEAPETLVRPYVVGGGETPKYSSSHD